jgi:Xaa-Pro aminopeptidase
MEERISMAAAELTLSMAERDRRWSKIRLSMALRNLDCLLIFGTEGNTYRAGLANLTYVTNFQEGWCCIFPINEEPTAFIGNQNKYIPWNYYEEVNPWIKDVRPMESKMKGCGLGGIIEKLKELGLEKGNIGFVDHEKGGFSTPYKHYHAVVDVFPHAFFSDQNGLMMEHRLIKSDEEIKMLEKAGQLANLSIQALLAAKPGMKEAEIYSNMLKAQIDNGGDPHCFILIESNAIAKTSHLLHGKKPPYGPKQRKLQKNDVILTEFHSSYKGYLAAVELTAIMGKPDPEHSHVYDVAVESFMNGLAMMKPGVPFNEVIMAFRKPVQKAGMDYLELGLHGHGLSSGEFPTALYPADRTKYLQITSSKDNKAFAPVSSFPLQENMVFGTNIDIHNPKWMHNVGVKLGDTVVIKKTGPQLLCQTPVKLSII